MAKLAHIICPSPAIWAVDVRVSVSWLVARTLIARLPPLRPKLCA
jgi:hypothetical protein